MTNVLVRKIELATRRGVVTIDSLGQPSSLILIKALTDVVPIFR
jgi:hypothetical protein